MTMEPKNIFLPPSGIAPWACLPQDSRGRLISEPESATRSVFQRDRDRIVHCGAFRRLKHKTQVFVYYEGDHYRTRLTHSLEVAQITRSICRVLGLNEDLAEALALAHDLGHPPFGHAGEAALDKCMQQFGGFDHNAQALRIVTRLEQRYATFDGLNLTWETLEGLVKHNGPLTGPGIARNLPLAIREYAEIQDLELHSYPSAEAQVSALSDDIAYCAHDIDDGLRAGLLDFDQMCQAPFAGPIFERVIARFPGVARGRFINEAVRELIGVMVEDLLAENLLSIASPNILTYHPNTAITALHEMKDKLDYHSIGIENRPPYVYFEEAFPAVVSRNLTEEQIWQIHTEATQRWGMKRNSNPMPEVILRQDSEVES